MHLLGSKALVLRAEITPEKLPTLYVALENAGIKLSHQSLPEIDGLKNEQVCPLSIQITSFSEDTDRRVNIPKVPG